MDFPCGGPPDPRGLRAWLLVQATKLIEALAYKGMARINDTQARSPPTRYHRRAYINHTRIKMVRQQDI